jgi:hypothetical protein
MLRNALLIVAFGISMAVGSPQDASIQTELSRLSVPEKLVPKDKQALFLFRAEGLQIYGTEEKEGKLQWVLQEPRADLLDYRTGEKVGTHAKGPGGPVWTDNAGSKLTGKRLANEPAPNASAVDWLLLEVKSENGGRFAKVTNIQRVDTWGGKPPAAAPAKAGETKEVRYEATYVLLGDK